ncbi:enoyl-CoA hydratase/isomerase family protein [Ktedonosporobacter rubrisoli]|uniref:enoyl-CoA hydratase/isomerase family protein n=1 Tax=Ktedonosporobacter rubrisoli TaxID=2509675 RepID=UPI0013EE9905|nr:enoyl-CoA hydratase-related protein [Ktedonosporobacter rubrisoli]
METFLIVEQRGPVGWITINRPEKRNAISLEMWYGLQQAIKELERSGIRALVITGAGEAAFASGADIMEFEDTKRTPEAARESFLSVDDTCRLLKELPIPVIGAIDGYAIGGGLELAVSCDFRIGTQRARLGITSTKMGITIGWGHIRRLVEALGPSWALDLLLSSRLVDADEALRIGLLQRIVPDHAMLLKEAQALGELFVERAPQALAWVKKIVYDITTGVAAPAPIDDANAAIRCFETADFQEAVQAFRAKRKPHFTGH